MANRAEHQIWGAAVGILVATKNKETPEWLANPISGALVGSFAGRIPDLIEPATSPNHRQFFHSWMFLGLLGYGLKEVYDWQPDDKLLKVLRSTALIVGAGYLSHLVLDALTKRSLPII